MSSTNTRKLASIALLAGLVIGFPVGYEVGKPLTKGEIFLGQMFAGAGYSSLALLQYQQADSQHAREALLGFVAFATSMEGLPDGQDKGLAYDVAFSYLRLASLEAKAGNDDLSEQYVSKAGESFKAAGRNYSRDELMKKVSQCAASANP